MNRAARYQWLLAALLLARGAHAHEPQVPAEDHTDNRAHPIRSIVVLPPLNQSADIDATYACLSTVTKPLAELGYYVFPVVLIDQYLKANGMPTAADMQLVPLSKVAEIIGADAVLYLEVTEYTGHAVTLKARMIDTLDLTLLWSNSARVVEESQGSNDYGNVKVPHNVWDVLGDVALIAIHDSASDAIQDLLPIKTYGPHLCGQANEKLFSPKEGPPFGPYSPRYRTN